jgi:hypothetical protein
MKRVLLLFCALFVKQILFAQFTTPTIDGTISTNEYGTHTNGFNQQSSGLNWFMTWDNTYLYVAVSNYNNTNDALVFYIDHNPLAIVNGGSNTDGTLTGTGYDGLTTTLPFRADFFAYLKPGYDDYKYHDGSGGWGSSTTGSLTKSNVSTVFEVRIPWSAVTNGGGIPASFNFLCFGGYNTGLYAQLPTQNTGGTVASVTLPYYYTVSTTANSTATKPFSRVSFSSKTGFSTLSSANSLYDFTLNSSAASFSALQNVSGTVTIVSGGSLSTGGNLTLKSTATNTASIAALSGSISGNVTCEKYIAGGGLSTAAPSSRAYRFLAHPFSSSIALSQLQTSIDITGTGTGFDASTSGNPSAFSWNGANSNGQANDAGWTAFTSTAATNWNQYQGIRVLYRGAKATGLDGNPYTVGSATLSMTGAVNTGTKTISLNYPNTGSNSNFNFVGNPYASNVQMSGVTNTNTTSSYYVWNIALGNRGGYSTVSFGSSYVLPAYAGFLVETNAASSSLDFHEADKTNSNSSNSLLRILSTNKLLLQLKSDNILWDELLIESNKNNTATKEYEDAKKLKNPDVSIYTLSSDNAELAIDKRNIKVGDIIPVGLSTNADRNFTIEVKDITISDVQLYLHDKYADKMQLVEAGMIYSFSTDANAASQGNNRFELVSKQAPILSSPESTITIKLSPNPVAGLLKITFTNVEKANTTISIANAEGKIVKTVDAGFVQNGQINLDVKVFSKGTYYVTLNSGTEKKTEKLIIQ